ncbi:MAG: cytochrome C biogenesis protein [Chloroflexota bacterium]
MNLPDLAFAFSAGMLATVNPCGFALLPAFIAYTLGTNETGFDGRPLLRRAGEGLILGLLVTLGFLAVFVGVGLVVSAGGRWLVRAFPWLAVAVGLILVGLGLWLLSGRSLYLNIAAPQPDLRRRGVRSLFLFGVAYAVASLSCTLPVFLVVVGGALAAGGLLPGLTQFISYGVGMGTVLIAISIGAAAFKGAVAARLRLVMPYVTRLSALLLILAGGYLIYRQLPVLVLLR